MVGEGGEEGGLSTNPIRGDCNTYEQCYCLHTPHCFLGSLTKLSSRADHFRHQRSDRAAEYPDITFRLRYEMAALAAPPTPPPSQQLAPLGQLAVLDQTTPQYTTQVVSGFALCRIFHLFHPSLLSFAISAGKTKTRRDMTCSSERRVTYKAVLPLMNCLVR